MTTDEWIQKFKQAELPPYGPPPYGLIVSKAKPAQRSPYNDDKDEIKKAAKSCQYELVWESKTQATFRKICDAT